MKRYTIGLITLLLIVGCSKPLDYNMLVEWGGKRLLDGKPYSGDVLKKYSDGGKEFKGSYKNGKKNGKWMYWNENGQKDSEINYKNGKKDGVETEWFSNGEISSEKIYEDGELISSK